jgi:hypothetical protein
LNDSNPEISLVEPAPTAHRKRRFSSETANDLLFWGAHLCIVAISLGIMWLKVDALTTAMRTILSAEEHQAQTLTQQAHKAEAATIQAQQAEHTRSIQFDAASKVLDGVLRQVSDIQTDIKATLAKTTEINQLVLQQSQTTKDAALQSQLEASKAAGAAQNAATTAGNAAGAAYRAAAVSSHTSTVVATKVVTSTAKEQLLAQKQALARKEAQLSRTIRQVKKNGPTLWQRLTH